MKMKFTGYLMFAFLSVLTLSYGMSGVAFAANSFITASVPEEVVPVFGNGDRVTLLGSIEDYDNPLKYDITYFVLSPDNNRVGFGQTSVNSDGTFEVVFTAGGPLWKVSGDYTVSFRFGSSSGEAMINYVGGEQPPPPPDPDVVTPPPPDVAPPPPPPPDVAPPPPPPPPKVDDPPKADDDTLTCGKGTQMVNGKCEAIPPPTTDNGGGTCLIATAAYGTELAPQIQLLREVRDGTVLSTASGSAFMAGFNTLYYSFAPTIADWERENPVFKDSVRVFITPMVSTLSIMTLADAGSEAEVLGYGISVIALNLAMYIAAPALIGFKVHQHFKSKK